MQQTVHPVFEQHKSLSSCEHAPLQWVVCQYEARTWGGYDQHSEINGINEHYSPLPVSLCNPKSITAQFRVSWWMHHWSYSGCPPVNAATLHVLYAALCKQPGVYRFPLTLYQVMWIWSKTYWILTSAPSKLAQTKNTPRALKWWQRASSAQGRWSKVDDKMLVCDELRRDWVEAFRCDGGGVLMWNWRLVRCTFTQPQRVYIR